MNAIFKRHQTLFMVQLVIVTAILFLFHSYLLNSFQPDYIFVIPLWNIYVFHVIAVFLVFSIINFRFCNGKTQVFNTFIFLMVSKMVFVIIFLLPLFFSTDTNKVAEATNFFVPYFIFLAFEVYSVNRLLTAK